MRLTTKRRLDLHLGRPVLVLLNLLATVLALVHRRRRRDGPVRRILVVKFQGMGSLAIARPAIRAVRGRYPEARIVFWGVRGTCALADHMPEFDETIQLEDSSLPVAAVSLVRCLARIWRQRFDWVFDLEVYSKLSSVFTTMTLARNRAGFAVFLVPQRKHLYTDLVIFNTYQYLGLAYQKLFGLILPPGSGFDAPPFPWRFPPARLAELPHPYVVLNTHVGDLCMERKWPQACWVELARRLRAAAPGTDLILLGWGDEEVAENRSWPADVPVVDLAGRLPVAELVRCLAHARLTVTVDSAALHLSILSATPVVGLFGPTRPRTYFPDDGPLAVSLSLELYCSPCLHHWDRPPCAGNNQCMKALAVDEVWWWASRMLGLADGDRPFARPRLVDPDYFAGRIYSA
jgi:ADP-heptose:LPS heptosyltransferase